MQSNLHVLDEYIPITSYSNKSNVQLVKDAVTEQVYVQKEYPIEHINRSVYDFILAEKPAGVPHIKDIVVVEEDYAEANSEATIIIIEQYISGISVAQKIASEGPLSESDARKLMYDVCEILKPFHNRKYPIINRDIKGSNLMFGEDGKLYLVDFNTARFYYDGQKHDTEMLGTLTHAAPEQIYNTGTDTRSDIFNLGKTIIEVIGGDIELASVSEDFVNIVQKATEIGRENRYQSVEDLQYELNMGYGSLETRHLARGRKQPGLLSYLRKPQFAVPVGIIIAVLVFLLANSLMKYKYNPDTDYMFELGADNFTVAEYEEAEPILKARLDLFAGKNNYSLEKDGTMLKLCLPKEVFHGEDAQGTLKSFVTRPAEPYVCNSNPDSPSERNSFKLRSSEIEEISIEHGTVSGVNPKDFRIESDEYDYIRIKLSDKAMKRIDEEFPDSWDMNLSILQDISGQFQPIYGVTLFADQQAGYFDVVLNTGSRNLLETTVYNWTNAKMPQAFTIFDHNCEWEDPEHISNAGLKQTSESSFGDDAIILSFKTASRDCSSGEILDIGNVLKLKFDAIGEPYAFGTNTSSGYTYFMIKTSPEKLGWPVFRAICTYYDYTVTASYATKYLTTKNSDAEVTDEADGTHKLIITCTNEYYTDGLARLKEIADSETDGAVKLVLDNGYMLNGHIISKNTLEFDRLCDKANSKITDDNVWLLDLVSSTINCDTDTEMIEFQRGSIAGREDELGLSDFDAERYENAIAEIEEKFDDCTVYINGTYMSVTLNGEYGKNMPKEFVKQVDSILKILDFKNCDLSWMTIRPCKPTNGKSTEVDIYKHLYTCSEPLDKYAGNGRFYVDTYTDGAYSEYADELVQTIDKYRNKYLSETY